MNEKYYYAKKINGCEQLFILKKETAHRFTINKGKGHIVEGESSIGKDSFLNRIYSIKQQISKEQYDIKLNDFYTTRNTQKPFKHYWYNANRKLLYRIEDLLVYVFDLRTGKCFIIRNIGDITKYFKAISKYRFEALILRNLDL